jgi:hypothetical protein
MKKPTPGYFGKATKSLLAGSMLAGTALLPSAAQAQGTIDTINFGGTVNQVVGNPGIPDGATVSGSFIFNLSSLTVIGGNGGSSQASIYSGPASINIDANGNIATFNSLEIGVLHNTLDFSGNNIPANTISIEWGPGYSDGVLIAYPVSSSPDSSINSFQEMISSGLSGSLQSYSDLNAGFVAASDASENNLVGGYLSGFSLDPTPEPSTLALGILGAGAFLLTGLRRNQSGLGINR